jgi:hypothetical protein
MKPHYLLIGAMLISLFNTANFGVKSPHFYYNIIATAIIGFVAFKYRQNNADQKS